MSRHVNVVFHSLDTFETIVLLVMWDGSPQNKAVAASPIYMCTLRNLDNICKKLARQSNINSEFDAILYLFRE